MKKEDIRFYLLVALTGCLALLLITFAFENHEANRIAERAFRSNQLVNPGTVIQIPMHQAPPTVTNAPTQQRGKSETEQIVELYLLHKMFFK